VTRQPKRKMPEPLDGAAEALRVLDNEVEDVVRTMAKWPAVRREVLEWIDSLTTTNCGWFEYQLAQKIRERNRIVEAHERK
jgi:hypothetical protein